MALKSCCCGCSLQNGTKVVGILTIIGSLLLHIKWIFTYIEIRDTDYTFTDMITPKNIAISVISSAIVIITSVLLLFAAWRNRAMLVVPWLVLNGIIMIGGLIYIIYEMVMAASWRNAGIAIGITIFVLGLLMYFWLVVYSYFVELQMFGITNESRPKRRTNNTA